MGLSAGSVPSLNKLFSGTGKLSWTYVLQGLLAVVIVYGMATKFFVSLSLVLSSDNVVPGLMVMEIWKHQNFFLTGFTLPAHDTYVFTDVVPFHLVPQILTGYDPTALKIESYVIFILLLVAISLLIYHVSRSRTSALIFAALAANINYSAYTLFATPNNHVATVFFAAVLLLLALIVNPICPETKALPGTEKTTPARSKPKAGKGTRPVDRNLPALERSWVLLALLLLAVTFLVVLSDSLIIFWFVLPYIIAYLVLYRPKTTRSDMVIIGMVIATGAAYVLKIRYIHEYVTVDTGFRSASETLGVSLPNYLNNLVYLLSQYTGSVLPALQLGIPDLISIAVIILLFGLSVFAAVQVRDPGMRFLYAILLMSAAGMTVLFLFSNYTGGLETSRYLLFTGLSIFIVVAMGFAGLKGRYLAALVSLVLITLTISLAASFLSLGSLDPAPNQGDYALIKTLTDRGFSHGYGTYWSANLLTYLSGENLVVRPVTFIQIGMLPNYWNSCGRWYPYERADTCLIVDNSTIDESERSGILVTTDYLNATGPEPYGKYLIYGLDDFRLSRTVFEQTPEGLTYHIE